MRDLKSSQMSSGTYALRVRMALSACSIGPKKLERCVWQKEMNLQKRKTRNLNLKEENSSRFILGDYSGLLLKNFVQ